MAGHSTSNEMEVMRLIMNTVPKRLTALVEEGTHENFQYIIMEKFGPSLQEMIARSKFGRFSVKTAVQI